MTNSTEEVCGENSILITVDDGDVPLAELLSNWDLLYLYPKLNDAGIDIKSLSLITELDLDKLFPEFNEIGVKIKMRSKIAEWRKVNDLNEHAATLSTSSSLEPYILDWVKSTDRNILPASPTPSTSSSAPDENGFVKMIIENMFRVPHIIEILKSLNEKSLDNTRELLCNKITAYLLEQKATALQGSDFQSIVDTIVMHCPAEKKDFYYQDGKIKRGKLFYKYRNTKTNLRQSGILQTKMSNKRVKLSNPPLELNKENLDDDIEAAKEWLKYHSEPWSTVERHWETTATSRIHFFQNSTNKTIIEFVKEWPLLKCAQGYHLIDMDFSHMYPENSANLLRKWTNDFSIQLYKILITRIKDKHVQEAGKKIQDMILGEEFLADNFDQTKKNFVIAELFRQLNGFLVPTSRKKSISGSRHWKPSIVESFDSFITYVGEISEIKKILEIRQKKYSEFGLAIQPSLFAEVETNPANSIKRVYIYYDNIFYIFENILNAIDINFKIYFTMNLKYSFESYKIFKFLEYVIYNIPSDENIPFELNKLKDLLENH